MNFFGNIKIKQKLIILILLPLLGLLYFAVVNISGTYAELKRMNRINDIANLATKISFLLHETQKERGMTAGFLGSKGKKFKDSLLKQRVLANSKFDELIKVNETIDFSLYPKAFNERMNDAINRFKKLNSIRPQVDSQSIAVGKAIGYYTKMNGILLDNVVAIAKLSDNAVITQQITAYSSFLLSKERAGIERAVGANTLSRDSFGTGMRTKLNDLISAQNSYMKTFSYYATTDANKFYDTTLKGKDVEEVNRIRNILLTANEIGGFGLDPIYWFDTITKKINLLKQVENHIRDNLTINNAELLIGVNIISNISNLLHETQKERGATAGFIGSGGKKFVKKLPDQRKLTSFRIDLLEKYLKNVNLNNYPKVFRDNLNASLSKLKHLKAMRQKVSALDISAKDAIGYYTGMNAQFLDTIALIIKQSTDVEESQDLTAFYNFLMAKERAGIERAVLSNTFARNKFLPGMKRKFIVLTTEQKSYLTSFKASARSEVYKFYIDTVQGKPVDEVQRMRDVALGVTTIGGFNIDPTYWFEQITLKINKLKKIDDYLATSLLKNIETLKDEAQNSLIFIWSFTILTLLVVLFMSRGITINILKSLKDFKEGLGFFFQYAIREKDYLKPMVVVGSDEFAQMTADMNEQIEKTAFIIEQDKKVVQEIDDVMAKIKSGFFCYTIKEKGATQEVEKLRNNINNMLKETKIKLDSINKILDNYAGGNYDFALNENEKRGMNGDMGSLITSSVLLGTSVSQLMAMISNAGEELTQSTNVLTSSSKSLSTSSNAQAASLEETAAAIEEITSNIENSSDNVINMSRLADELNSSADTGRALASQTASSMDEINSKVTAINEAIEVIDQIAFQTNILSLNAAVEAATAGEAGKGFAVVAQEVRNLASRSAEAAKDIKELVEDATQKSHAGKDAATKMIGGYTELNKKIVETKEIIDTVTISSREQKEGMAQINDAVNSLDRTTQENAATANSIDNLAKEVSDLSTRLINITERATFNPEIKKQVCDFDLVQEIAQYKNDHINFKDTNFAKLDTFDHWHVVDCKSCKLGKWVIATEESGKSFTNSTTWNDLKSAHEQIHGYVQEYVTQNHERIDNDILEATAVKIENATDKIFTELDNLLIVHCEE